MATKKLILDLDMGVDDAMALAYAIASPEVELVGITTCFGNVRVEQSAHNCLAVLDLLGRPEVPVYLGADRLRESLSRQSSREVTTGSSVEQSLIKNQGLSI